MSEPKNDYTLSELCATRDKLMAAKQSAPFMGSVFDLTINEYNKIIDSRIAKGEKIYD